MGLEVRCPYYWYEGYLKIKCENADVQRFEEHKKLIEFEHLYCCSNWKNCSTAKTLNEYYEKKEKLRSERLFEKRLQNKKEALQKEKYIEKQKIKIANEKESKEINKNKDFNKTNIIYGSIVKTSYGKQVHEICEGKGIERTSGTNEVK